jgi:hypothetical protein
MGRLPKVKQFTHQDEQHRTNSSVVATAVKMECCSRKCKQSIPNVLRASHAWRVMYSEMTHADRRQFLLDCVRRWLREDGSVDWFFETTDGYRYSVCKAGFKHLTGIGGYALTDRHTRALAGHTTWLRKPNLLSAKIKVLHYPTDRGSITKSTAPLNICRMLLGVVSALAPA